MRVHVGQGRREIDVASMFRMLGGEYMVESGKLVVVGIPRFRVTAMEEVGEMERERRIIPCIFMPNSQNL